MQLEERPRHCQPIYSARIFENGVEFGANIFASEAFGVLEKPGLFRQGVLGQTAQVPGCKLIPGGPLDLSPGGGEVHGERLFPE